MSHEDCQHNTKLHTIETVFASHLPGRFRSVAHCVTTIRALQTSPSTSSSWSCPHLPGSLALNTESIYTLSISNLSALGKPLLHHCARCCALLVLMLAPSVHRWGLRPAVHLCWAWRPTCLTTNLQANYTQVHQNYLTVC